MQPPVRETTSEDRLDADLTAKLAEREFTGRISETLEARLGRSIDTDLAEIGRLLFFDPITSLTEDNSCSGCHGPNASFGDSKSIAIGVGNNGVVGPGRAGPRNLRRAPTLINVPFYPALMWDSRFQALSLDPFDNSKGFAFPPPDGTDLSGLDHLLVAQAFTPVINRSEMAGFDFAGDHHVMRGEVADRVWAVDEYRQMFQGVFPELSAGTPFSFEYIARAIAEFTFTLVRANAPIDRYARGDLDALTPDQKEGGILFFGRAMCGECHIVKGFANEMFSDFEAHVLGVPQVAPIEGNVPLDGPGGDEDFGLERVTGERLDRYRFRTSPLRNVALQAQFMHNGAYVCLDRAIRHHLDAVGMLASYTPDALDTDLQGRRGPDEPMIEVLHDLIRDPVSLSQVEFDQILDFVTHALTDPDAAPDRLMGLVPESVPSGLPVHTFETVTPSDCAD
ncbi:MAG: cytochrome c peroxidase [Longimicrobiales bacterium]|nr:cytochrome c peroxidase [Longimicrobiales bacterium]